MRTGPVEVDPAAVSTVVVPNGVTTRLPAGVRRATWGELGPGPEVTEEEEPVGAAKNPEETPAAARWLKFADWAEALGCGAGAPRGPTAGPVVREAWGKNLGMG